MRTLASALFTLSLLLAAVEARAGDGERLLAATHEEWQDLAEAIIGANAAAQGPDPLTTPMVLCEEAGCVQTGAQALTPAEAARLRGLFADGEDSPAAERTRIRKAIALYETLIGTRNGTWRDHPGNEREYPDEPGQLDCIAESVNTLTYLSRLAHAGLLNHHQVGSFIHRYTVVLQHVAVDIVETGTEDRYAVDSWVGANGEEPELLPYADWRWEWGV
ncbi:MAG TPA: hypothetical protein VL974_16015 [Magnetospirillum sp.]|jgi:hypothetical protein|nr:hypothetical protein [Magnetospirillum sp.]